MERFYRRAESRAMTDETKAPFSFIWKINCIPKVWPLKSPEFTVQSMEMTKWFIRLNLICLPMFCCLRRLEVDDGPESIELDIEVSLFDNDGCFLSKKLKSKRFQKNFSLDILERSEMESIFNDTRVNIWQNTLTVQCRLWRTRTKISKTELCFASSHFNAHQYSCVWAIKDFVSLQQGEKRTRILNSATKERPELILSLSLGEKNGQECVNIHAKTPSNETLWAKISVLNVFGMVCDTTETCQIASGCLNSEQLIVLENSQFLSDAANMLSDDVLLLRCEFVCISFFPVWSRIEDYKLMEYFDSETISIEKNEKSSEKLNKTVVCPFKETVSKFKENGIFSDVSLRSGNKSFPVHKFILSIRSPVFKAMFTNDMREKSSKCIDIPDLDEDTMKRMLLFIYENKVQKLTWDTTINLFGAADKYELLTLKEKCSCFLKSNISNSNVCELIVLADMHNDEDLRKSAQEFVLYNSEILHSDVWKVFRDNHFKLALETTEQIICNLKRTRS